ncbi:hypothetical protein SUGI_0370940 [Cryptomeria japonica]|uniref:protein ELC n=1 Tax=Cryptomeria japonica TaxID=3369 RepID=UPI002408A916|nr:protein ELC [Cryptomeria japonica]GLJ20421.1 hypothetical protein SUGI_0370940 [Cryptomeria japonica]
MTPTATSTTAGQDAQFLNRVLSQRGSSALPYEEDLQCHIRQHLLSLMQAFPNLIVQPEMFTHNDGRTVDLLKAEGTIPVLYKQVTYNIPVRIWLLEQYSKHPPLVYVTPTRDMEIKRGHILVDPSGLVSCPYLKDWAFPSSNLVEMVNNLSFLFGKSPPVYTTMQSAAQNQNNHVGGHGALVSHSKQKRLAPEPRGKRSSHKARDEQIQKTALMNKLVETFHKDMAELTKTMEMEMEGLLSIPGVLKQRGEQAEKGIGELQEEKEKLEQQVQSILACSDELETWLQEKESKESNLSIDHVCQPCDVLSNQMLESTSADLAIEDILYCLDKAVQDGAITVKDYLKNVRTMSREQFFNRAMSIKVSAAQLQVQVANMADTAQTYDT